jgi:hypothetical protein
VRCPAETVAAFHRRLVRGEADEPRSRLPASDGPPMLAALFRGDVDLPDGSLGCALCRDRVPAELVASDLLSAD